jgi:hypothetical protein
VDFEAVDTNKDGGVDAGDVEEVPGFNYKIGFTLSR